jgi:L-alanine-DL-glutamate epimerase-like enolase superfamily enzyme
MNIAEIHLFQHELPVRNGPYIMSQTTVHSLTTTLVKVVTDTGLTGWGETCPVGPTYAPSHSAGAYAALAAMAPDLIGVRADAPLILHRAMDGLLNGHSYAKAALDIAIYDLIGKHLGVSVADLLGGALTNRVPSYYAASVGAPDEVARIAAEKQAEGYPRLQIKLGGREVAEDIAVIKKVWEAVGPTMRLAVDGNRGWSTRDVIHLSQACRDIPFVLEQPCDTLEELAMIRPRIHHPLYVDEGGTDINTIIRILGEGLADGFGMKLTRIGGLQKMVTFRELCSARHVPHTCDDSWGGDIIAAACVHVGATVQPRLLEGVWLAQPYIENSYDEVSPVKIVDGHITVPEGPGLGVLPDESLFGSPVASYA